MRRLILIAAGLLAMQQSFGAVPSGYYSDLDGKSGEELKAAVKSAALPSGYKTVTYNSKTWEAFPTTDIRIINGEEIWWDMYSNNIVYTSSHDSMNIEHSVANSWWGGTKNDAYKDLFHLNPSDQAANGMKSSNPMGLVSVAAYDNGLIKVGTPSGEAGGAPKVFEPSDEYKGDFARAYLYIFTAFDDLAWIDTDNSNYNGYNYELTDGKAELQSWFSKLLVEWSKADPVDSKESNRNEAIYVIQKNRNPFIDYPELVDYIWGDKVGETFHLGEAATIVERPSAPTCDYWMRGVNTYSGRWWDKTEVKFDNIDGDLWISINGGIYERYGSSVEIAAATKDRESVVLRAYTEKEVSGYTLRSNIVTLTLTAQDPQISDYAEAVWTLVTSNDDIDSNSLYVFVSPTVKHVMGSTGGTTSMKYMKDEGFVKYTGNNITELPTDAAIVKFEESGNEEAPYLVRIFGTELESKGYWNVSGTGNTMTLNSTTGNSASININDEGTAEILFPDATKYVMFNKSQERFSNYGTNTSTGTYIWLYKFSNFNDKTGVIDLPAEEGGVSINGNTICMPTGWRLFDINGRQVSGLLLQRGIYILVSPRGTNEKIYIK